MKVRQLRATLEEFAGLYEVEGNLSKANALRALSRALEGASTKQLNEVIPILEAATPVAQCTDEVSSKR